MNRTRSCIFNSMAHDYINSKSSAFMWPSAGIWGAARLWQCFLRPPAYGTKACGWSCRTEGQFCEDSSGRGRNGIDFILQFDPIKWFRLQWGWEELWYQHDRLLLNLVRPSSSCASSLNLWSKSLARWDLWWGRSMKTSRKATSCRSPTLIPVCLCCIGEEWSVILKNQLPKITCHENPWDPAHTSGPNAVWKSNWQSWTVSMICAMKLWPEEKWMDSSQSCQSKILCFRSAPYQFFQILWLCLTCRGFLHTSLIN